MSGAPSAVVPERVETSPAFSSSSYLAVNATITTVCRSLGVGSGLALDAVVVALFGLSELTDAYFAALAIPVLLTSTLETQGPKILVPFFARAFEKYGRQDTWSQVRSLMAASSLLFAACAMALVGVAWLLMPVQVPGLGPETVRIAVRLQMILAWTVLTQGLSAVISGALYADHHYIVTTTARFTTNVVTIAVAVMAHRALGIYALAVGLLAGSTVQLGCLLGAAGARGFRVGRTRLRDPRVAKVLPLSVYPLVGQTLGETTVFMENFLASLLGGGALSIVRYANRIVAAAAGVLVGGLITTSLPMLSQYAAAGRFEEMKEGLLKTLRFVALLGVPLGLLLVFAGEPIVAVAFERGRFTAVDTSRLALMLGLLAPYILFSRVVGVAEAAFYAVLDMRTPLRPIAVFLITYAGACWLLLPRLGVFAFAVAMSFGAAVAALSMIRLVQLRFGRLPWAGSRVFGRRLAAVTAISVAGFFAGSAASVAIDAGGTGAKIATLLAVAVPGTAAFVGSAVAVRLVNLSHLLHLGRRTGASRIGGAAA